MWIRALGMVMALVVLNGCSFMKGLLNPEAAWAIAEPAPMSMVVRRAEVAAHVAEQVDRVLSETPADDAARKALLLTEQDAESLMKAASQEPAYAKEPLRVVPAEAWLSALSGTCGRRADAPPLIGALGDEAALAYLEVVSQGAKVAKLESDIARIEEKLDTDGLGAGKRKELESRLEELENEKNELEDSLPEREDELVEQVSLAAKDLDDDGNGPVIANLLEAVDDARIANSAAMIRYPLAAIAILDDLQTVAPRIVADVVEEQTGARPIMNGFSPGVSLEGGDLELTLNGLTPEQMGGLDMGELLQEVTDRAQAYVTSVLTLLVTASNTEARLELLERVLEAWQAGLGNDSAESAIDITDLDVTSSGKPLAKKQKKLAKVPKRSATGLAVTECRGPMPLMVAQAHEQEDEERELTPARSTPTPGKRRPSKRKSRRRQKRPPVAIQRRSSTPGVARHTTNDASKKAPRAEAPGATKWIDDPR